MIRFSAIVSVVAVALGLLVVGAVSGKLVLVYLAIALAALALLMLVAGVVVWRDEIFGHTTASGGGQVPLGSAQGVPEESQQGKSADLAASAHRVSAYTSVAPGSVTQRAPIPFAPSEFAPSEHGLPEFGPVREHDVRKDDVRPGERGQDDRPDQGRARRDDPRAQRLQWERPPGQAARSPALPDPPSGSREGSRNRNPDGEQAAGWPGQAPEWGKTPDWGESASRLPADLAGEPPRPGSPRTGQPDSGRPGLGPPSSRPQVADLPPAGARPAGPPASLEGQPPEGPADRQPSARPAAANARTELNPVRPQTTVPPPAQSAERGRDLGPAPLPPRKPPSSRQDAKTARPEANRGFFTPASPADDPAAADPDADVRLGSPAAAPTSPTALPKSGSGATAAGAPAADTGAPGTPAAAAPAAEQPAGPAAASSPEVTVVPGIARYHMPDCILIRFLGEEDLQTMPLAQAEQTGCVPCRACRPEKELANP